MFARKRRSGSHDDEWNFSHTRLVFELPCALVGDISKEISASTVSWLDAHGEVMQMVASDRLFELVFSLNTPSCYWIVFHVGKTMSQTRCVR